MRSVALVAGGVVLGLAGGYVWLAWYFKDSFRG